MFYLPDIQKGIQFIEENLGNNLTIDTVAQSANYSSYHYSRIFSEYTGVTLGGYIKSRKLSIASTELLHSKEQLLNIASHAGYQSYEAFSRAFKYEFNQSPFYYRKNQTLRYLMNRSILDDTLLKHITSILSVKPFEVFIPALELVGYTVSTQLSDNQLPSHWASFKHTMVEQLQADPTTCETYAICESPSASLTMEGNSTFSTFLSYLKSDCKATYSQELKTNLIPKGKYRVFRHQASYHSLELSYRYIWHIWIHASPFNYDHSRVSFEQHAKDGTFTLIYIPVK